MKVKNQKGFTLVEMLIVLLVVSILLLITIPNVTKHNSVIKDKGCDALVNIIDTINMHKKTKKRALNCW